MLKLFLISSFLGALSNLIQAPWNFFLLIFLIFPILHLILDSKIKDQSYLQRFISLLLILGGFLYFYFLFGFSWIISAFEFRPELSSFKFITLFGLPLLMLIFISPSFVIPTIFWDTRVNKILSLASCISIGEFLRGNIFTGFPWNNFSHSLAINENLMQIFSITGQYLATFFLIVISQFLLFFWKD
jgi:Apolipoprotein N-acyltransferase